MSLVLDTGTMKYRENPNQPWRPLVIKAGMNWESMADTYDPNDGTYEVGQYVLEEGMMYRCISEITTPEAWTPAHWTSVNVGDELSSFIIISDDQPTDETNKIWIAETTAPFGVQVPTMDDHNALGNTLNYKAAKVDLTNISQSSPNCTVTNGIANGTYFYLDGVLTRATAPIAENATFTSSNCVTVTAGGLNNIMSEFTDGIDIRSAVTISTGTVIQKAIKKGSQIIIWGSAKPSASPILNIPASYRPTQYTALIVGLYPATPEDFGYGSMSISVGGDVTFTYSNTPTYNIYFCAIYNIL